MQVGAADMAKGVRLTSQKREAIARCYAKWLKLLGPSRGNCRHKVTALKMAKRRFPNVSAQTVRHCYALYSDLYR